MADYIKSNKSVIIYKKTLKGDKHMKNLQNFIENYLNYCQHQKQLDSKTLKAYRIDLTQFSKVMPVQNIHSITAAMLEQYISELHDKYKPKTVKRKIASIRALFHHLEYKEIIEHNPFHKIQIKFREPFTLPKTIPLHTVETFLSTIYQQHSIAKTEYKKKCTLRDIAVIELLFATGIRISELCTLKPTDINLYDKTLLIYGKGAKERRIQIGNDDIVEILKKYKDTYYNEITHCQHFFVTPSGNVLTDQAVRRMINKYVSIASIDMHITPHMFRHTFATSLLEADVDIRYIQEMLGHSSINITEIYTHVALSKQREILTTKHPRNQFDI